MRVLNVILALLLSASTWAVQVNPGAKAPANTIAAGPTSGADAVATYRTLTDVDLAKAAAVKSPVRAASTANGTLSTAFENGDSFDGLTLATGDRILLKDQSTASQNGIYIVAASGAPARATDADEAAELPLGLLVPVKAGTAGGGKVFLMTANADPVVVNTSNLTFTAISGSGGGSTPTGTGFPHITSGSQDAAAKLVDTADVNANQITYAKIQQGVALSVIGNSTNGTANVADIAAASDHQILRRSGTAIGFGSINLASSVAVGASLLPIGNGGTGQATQTSAFDALSPTTTQGDTIYFNGTDNVRLAKGTAFQSLGMNSGATAPEWQSAPAFRAHRNGTDQTGADAATGGAYTIVKLTNEDYDTHSWFDTTTWKYTPQRAGKYFFCANVGLLSCGNATLIVSNLYKNGTTSLDGSFIYNASGSTANMTTQAVFMVEMNGSTDYVQLRVFNGNVGNKDINGSATATSLGGYWIGP
jgi:hypothetical protein